MRAVAAAALLLGAGFAAALAQPAPIDVTGARPDERTIAAGRAVAAGAGGQGQAGACFRCHGFDGAAQAAAAFPALAGQSAEYLHEQLKAYASGRRPNAIMGPIASALAEQQMRSVAAYYAAQPDPPQDGRPGGDPALLQWGGVLSAIGSAEAGVQACQNCHGPAGTGMPPMYPRLAGQPQAYLAAQLRAWKSGERPGDPPYHFMANIAKRLADRDIEAVSLYFASVRLEEAQGQIGVLP
jgi:cytochrome c553